MSDGDRDDRPSWREIDRRKDKSFHRKEERGKQGPQVKSTKGYRQALDRLFDTGKVGQLVDKLEDAKAGPKGAGKEKSTGRKARKPPVGGLLRKIREAVGQDEVTATVNELLKHYQLPDDDYDVLTRTLDHEDEAVVLQALQKLESLLARKPIQRRGALVMRLQALSEDARKKEVRQLAATLHDRLT